MTEQELRIWAADRLMLSGAIATREAVDAVLAAVAVTVETPAAVPAKRTSRRGVMTRERLAVIAEHWPTRMPTAEITAMVNALPGPPANNRFISAVACQKLGLKRPVGMPGADRMQRARDARAAKRLRLAA